jgi:hypothetical protein
MGLTRKKPYWRVIIDKEVKKQESFQLFMTGSSSKTGFKINIPVMIPKELKKKTHSAFSKRSQIIPKNGIRSIILPPR